MILIALILGFADPQVSVSPEALAVRDEARLGHWKAQTEKQLQAVGRVSVVQKDRGAEVAMLGGWTVKDALIFTPRFGFEAGTEYRLVLADGFEKTFTLLPVEKKPGKVLKVYPEGNKLPANLLRFYLHFESEMKPGQGYQHFQLLDHKGKRLDDAFLELDEELWSEDGKRLTLLLHPGRVKRDLKPREDLGPVLVQGNTYTLVISKAMQTITGAKLAEEFRKEFTATAAVETGIENWKIVASNQGVTLQFDRPMDHALKRRVIRLESEDGQPVDGRASDYDDDENWTYLPKKPLKPGKYRIVMDSVLEDVCGNRIGAAFDAALGKVGARAEKPPTKILIEVR